MGAEGGVLFDAVCATLTSYASDIELFARMVEALNELFAAVVWYLE